MDGNEVYAHLVKTIGSFSVNPIPLFTLPMKKNKKLKKIEREHQIIEKIVRMATKFETIQLFIGQWISEFLFYMHREYKGQFKSIIWNLFIYF
jgi:hypothetical protein